MKNRILYVDYMKGFAIILVIMYHVNFANESLKPLLASFLMPAFFFSTGLVLRVGEQISLRETFMKKLHRLMLPYLLWALLYAKFSVFNLLKIFYGSYWSIAHAGTLTSLWFLPVMFVALAFFYLFVKTGLANRLVYKLLLMVIVFTIGCILPHLRIGYPWGVDVAFMAFAFMLLGNISQDYLERLYLYFKAHTTIGLTISILLFMLMFVCTQTYQLNNPLGGWVNMKCANYGNHGLFALTAVCGTMMLLFFSIFIELLNNRGFKWLSFVGQNTLCIFLIHKPIITCFRFLISFNIPDVVLLTITVVGTLILSSLLCLVINRFLPIMVGR